MGTTPSIVRTEWEGEVLFHKDLWRAAVANAEHAESLEKGAFYFDLAALLLAACAVEGFANYLLSIVSPPTFEKERQLFSGEGELTGTKGKLNWLARQCGLSAPDLRYDLRIDVPLALAGYVVWNTLQALNQELAERQCRWCDDHLNAMDRSVRDGTVSPSSAARELLRLYHQPPTDPPRAVAAGPTAHTEPF